MLFDIEIKLPSGKVRRVPELSNKDYLTIIKYIQNNDNFGLNKFFESTILDPDLNIFDRFYLLLYYRMTFIDEKIVINKEERHIDISLVSLLDRLEANYKDLETVFVEDGIEVTLDLPTISYFNKIDELFISTIKSIKFGDKTLNFYELDDEEQTAVLDNLPVNVFNHIRQYIETISKDLLDVTLISENQTIGVERIGIDVIGNGVIEFISSIFSTDLKEFYNMLYIFQNTITPGSNLFFDLSPVETRIVMNHHNQRIKEENEELKKQQQQ